MLDSSRLNMPNAGGRGKTDDEDLTGDSRPSVRPPHLSTPLSFDPFHSKENQLN